MKQIIAALASALILAAAVIGACYSMRVYSAKDSAPLMFVNDEPWYNEYLYPMVDASSVDYAPISIFGKINGVTIKDNKQLGDVMITHGNGKFLTFKEEKREVYDAEGNKSAIYILSLYGGELYVPVYFICEYFGFKFEKTTKDGTVAVRVKNTDAKLSFNELLEKYNPDMAEIPEKPVVTTRPVTETTEAETTAEEAETEPIGEREIFISIYGGLNEYSADIMSVLDYYEVPAAFYIDPDTPAENTALLRALDAGHGSIGLVMDSLGDTSETDERNVLKDANDVLYILIKKKTRLVGLTPGFYSLSDEQKTLKKKALTDRGYVTRGYSYFIKCVNIEEEKTAVSDFQEFLMNNETVALAFDSTEYTSRILRAVLGYIAPNPQFGVYAQTSVSPDF